MLSLFVAWLHSRQLAAGTVKNYLAAVRHTQIALGLGDPRMGNMAQLEYVIRGGEENGPGADEGSAADHTGCT